jgi:hypothetical protein
MRVPIMAGELDVLEPFEDSVNSGINFGGDLPARARVGSRLALSFGEG